MTNTDVAILGGGPGGYVAALRAAQLGAQVTLVEQDKIGGVCLNVGCIPTKTLLRTAEVYRTTRQAERFGLTLEGKVAPNWVAVQDRKEATVERLRSGVEVLLRKANVQILKGCGQFVSPKTIEIAGSDGEHRLDANSVIIATGSRSIKLSLPGFDLPGVIDSTGALTLERLPGRLLIIGGGPIGVEFADLFNAFGVHVTIVEMLSSLLPSMDVDLGKALAWILTQRGVRVYVDSRVNQLNATENGLRGSTTTPSGAIELEADCVLVAVGRRPNIEGLGLELTGVQVEASGIGVDAHMQTTVPGVYAVGDVTGSVQLAHVASMGGEVAAECAMGHMSALDLKSMPSIVFTQPEVASVGLSEREAYEAGYDVQVGRFPLSANAKAMTYGDIDGLVKIVSDSQVDAVLGVHVVAPHASDLIHEGVLALALEVTLDDLISTMHGHPTMGEAMREAAMAAQGRSLHLP